MKEAKKVAPFIAPGLMSPSGKINPLGDPLHGMTKEYVEGVMKPPAADPREGRLAAQKVKEEARLDTISNEQKKKKTLLARGGFGRSLLIRTSPIGLPGRATALGGA